MMCASCRAALDFPTALTVEDVCVRLCDACCLRWANGALELEIVPKPLAPEPRQGSIFDILEERP